MGTLMQKKAAEITLETVRSSKRTTKGKILREAGYSHNLSLQPEKVFETEGFKEELDNFGLTEELIKTALVADIKAKPKRRERELRLASELRGLLNDKPSGNTTNNFTQIVIHSSKDAKDVRHLPNA